MLRVFLLAWSALAAEPLTYEGVVSLIQKHKIKSVEGLLEVLPEEFRDSYSLVYETGSLNPASALSPRTIFFGADASFILTFNDASSHERANIVEMAQWRNDEQLELRTVEFSKDGKAPPVLSKKNPAECTQCHGDPPKYVYFDYPQWHGNYGADDNALDLTPGEYENFKKFVEKAKGHPRYKWLPKLGTGPQKVFPYHLGEIRSTVDGKVVKNDQRHLGTQPDVRLTALMLRRMARRSFRLSSQNPNYAKLKEAALYLGAECDLTTEDGKKIVQSVLDIYADTFPEKAKSKEFLAIQEKPSAVILNRAVYELFGLSRADSLIKPQTGGQPPETVGARLSDDDGFTKHSALLLTLIARDLLQTIPEVKKHFAVDTLESEGFPGGGTEELSRAIDKAGELRITRDVLKPACEALGKKAVISLSASGKGVERANRDDPNH